MLVPLWTVSPASVWNHHGRRSSCWCSSFQLLHTASSRAPAASRGPVGPAGIHHPVHAAVRWALPGGLRPALAPLPVQAQALELPERLPLPVSAVVGPAHRPLLLLLPQRRAGQPLTCGHLLAALLLPRLPAVLHAQPHQPVLYAGEEVVAGYSQGCFEVVLVKKSTNTVKIKRQNSFKTVMSY